MRRIASGRARHGLLLAGLLALAACGDDVDASSPESVEESVTEPADAPADADDPFADDDPFAGEDVFAADDWDDGDIREGPGALPAELQFLLDVPPGARLDHVEAIDGPHGFEYSVDGSHHEGGAAELAAAADHYRAAFRAAGFDIIDEFVEPEEVMLYAVGHGLEASTVIDIEMGSVWINVFLFPELP